ncbi:MAG: putative HTH-type transcriptional regulator [Herbaspirillum frisingense]|uniref:Putative HTH-type transcriptional regulator n=1 Tax=Herbaspirillum frisingense TaxID=92645 RepID=A0A7V8FYV9_9BURK|nr:MAG: putative HTH-type transcriptional regulator [Herbaspirillum frisingense]
MLNGKDLGQAIELAITLKIASGAAKSKADIARHFNVKPPSIYDWVNKGSISKDKLPELWNYFSDVVSYEHWGLKGWPHIASAPGGEGLGGNISGARLEPAPPLTGRVPIISWVQAGEFTEAIEPVHVEEWADTSAPVMARTFALRVKGDSMSPEFPEGVIIVVEPDLEPIPGDFVIARNGGGEATFKQLVRDGADFYLKPLNPRYPIKALGSSLIIGVVREMVKKFR